MAVQATFIATPDEFFSKITATDYASTVIRPGRNNLGTVIGTDGEDYVVLSTTNIGSSPKPSMTLWNIRTGVFHTYSDTDLTAFFSVTVPSGAAIVPVQGTKYIWVFWPVGTDHATFIWEGRILEVHDQDTIARPSDISDLTDEGPSLESWDEINVVDCRYNEVTGQFRVFLQNVRHGGVVMSHDACCYFDIKSQPGQTILGNSWSSPTEPSAVDNAFFQLFDPSAAPIINYGAFAMAVQPQTGAMYALFYIGAVQWDYIQSHPADSVAFPFITGVGLYRYDFPTGQNSERPPDAYFPWYDGVGDTITGPIVGPDFSDSNCYLDGTPHPITGASGRPPDDYASLNIFTFANQSSSGIHFMTFSEMGSAELLDFPSITLTDQFSYIVMARSYTRAADLATEGTGSYIRVKIYRYDPTLPLVTTLVIDESYSILDTILNLGADVPGKNLLPPNFIQTVQAADKNYYYVFGIPSSLPTGNGVLAAGRVVHTSGYAATLPEIGESSEISFDSFLDTWWTLSDNAALWAENPYLITYVDNTDTNPSLLMTPRWEWTESDTNHKSGPQVEVMIARDGTVSDRRNRIRGKGRALQLHFQSTEGRPFNLLGWSINLDKNANY